MLLRNESLVALINDRLSNVFDVIPRKVAMLHLQIFFASRKVDLQDRGTPLYSVVIKQVFDNVKTAMCTILGGYYWQSLINSSMIYFKVYLTSFVVNCGRYY